MGDVADQEWLHRRVTAQHCRSIDPPLLSSTAFNDPGKKPSVDRASMRRAEQTQRDPTDGVARLQTIAVRKLVVDRTDPPEGEPTIYEIDVWARPLADNTAHAQIEPLPEMTGSRFLKMKERLARLAQEQGWAIHPTA